MVSIPRLPWTMATNVESEADSSPEQIYQLVTGLIEEDLLYLLAVNLWRLPFESRKDTQVIFSYVFRFRPPTASPKSDPLALSYVVNNRPQVLLELCRGYEHKESATPAGSVLREVLKSEAAAAIILYDDNEESGSSNKGINLIDRDRRQSGDGVFWRFFDWIDKSSFEVAADAFTTFRVRRPDPLATANLELRVRFLTFCSIFRNFSRNTRSLFRGTCRSTSTSSSTSTITYLYNPTVMSPSDSPSNYSARSCWTAQTIAL